MFDFEDFFDGFDKELFVAVDDDVDVRISL